MVAPKYFKVNFEVNKCFKPKTVYYLRNDVKVDVIHSTTLVKMAVADTWLLGSVN